MVGDENKHSLRVKFVMHKVEVDTVEVDTNSLALAESGTPTWAQVL